MLRMVRIINLSETEVPVELAAVGGTGMSNALYTGQIGTQGPRAGDGEVVLQPSKIVEPLQYDYHLTISGSQKTKTLLKASDPPIRANQLNIPLDA